jgi:hypothetical protein
VEVEVLKESRRNCKVQQYLEGVEHDSNGQEGGISFVFPFQRGEEASIQP